jgi:hypothetical protein
VTTTRKIYTYKFQARISMTEKWKGCHVDTCVDTLCVHMDIIQPLLDKHFDGKTFSWCAYLCPVLQAWIWIEYRLFSENRNTRKRFDWFWKSSTYFMKWNLKKYWTCEHVKNICLYLR